MDNRKPTTRMNTIKPKLISFKLCPFVQKAVILLGHKQIDYDIEYIDLAEPPDWFRKISPYGKVPVLIVNNDVIFESSVILEYLDEACPPPLHPDDLIEKALHRSWMEFSSTCLWDIFDLTVAETEQAFNDKLSTLHEHLDRVEAVLSRQPYFAGQHFSLVDIAFAPVFVRLELFQPLIPQIYDSKRHPKIQIWKQQLLNHPAVAESTVDGFEKLFQASLWKRQGFLSGFLDADLFE